MKETKTHRRIFTRADIIEAVKEKWGIKGQFSASFRVVGKNDPDDWRAEYPLSHEFEELIIDEIVP